MSEIGTAYLDIKADFSKVGRKARAAARKVQGEFARVDYGSAAVRTQGKLLEGLKTSAKIGAEGTAAALGAGTAKVVTDGFRFNATMESNRLALTRFLGDGQKAGKFVRDLFDTAKRTPFQFTDLTTASRRLMSFGLGAKKTLRLLNATGDAVAAMGGSADNIDRVTLALGQMQSKGKVSAQELLQLTEAGIPAYKILQDELRLTGDQIGNIGNEGITAEKGIAALTRGMEKRFKGAAREQSKTWDGMTSTMKDSWSQMTGSITTGLFKEAKKWVPTVNKTMDDVAAIFNRKDLSFEAKLKLSKDKLAKDTAPLRREIGRQLGKVDAGKAIGDAIEWGIPKAADAVAEGVPKLASAMWEGFKNMGTAGQLLTGAFVLSRLMGGRKSFVGAGTSAGGGFRQGLLVGIGGGIGGIVGAQVAEGVAAKFGARGGRLGKLGEAFGQRGASPANPLFVEDVTGGGGGPGRKPRRKPTITDKASGIGKKVAGPAAGGGGVSLAARGKNLLTKGAKVGVRGGALLMIGIEINRRLGKDAIARSRPQRFSYGLPSPLVAPMTTGERRGGIRPGDLSGPSRQGRESLRRFSAQIDQLKGKLNTLSPKRLEELKRKSDALGRTPGTEPWRRQLRALSRDLDKMAGGRVVQGIKMNFERLNRDGGGSLERLRLVTATHLGYIKRTLGTDTAAGRQALTANFKGSVTAIARSMRSGKLSVEDGTREMRRSIRVNTTAGKDALARNYRAAQRIVAQTMRNSKGVTEEGMRQIRALFAAELRAYGLSDEAVKFRLAGREQSGKTIGAPLVGKQRGGPITWGKPSGDSVPALLEKGEYVLNRKAVAKIGRGNLDRVNFRGAPRFQSGGLAGRYPGVTGDTDFVPALGAALSKLARSSGVGIFVQNGRRDLAEQQVLYNRYLAGAGPLAAKPTPNAPHVRGIAADITPGRERFGAAAGRFGLGFTVPSESWHIQLLDAGAGGARASGPVAAGTARPIRRVRVAGPPSALKSIMQGALDKTRRAVNSRLTELAGDPLGGMSGGGSNAANQRLAKQMAARLGWTGPQWDALQKLWTRESGFSTTADNPTSAAYGIPQALPGSKMASEGADWATNPATQIRWGLKYIKARYGSPLAALAKSDAVGWYAKGGMVGGDGGSIADYFGFQPGGPVAQLAGKKKAKRRKPKKRKRAQSKRQVSSRALAQILGRYNKLGVRAADLEALFGQAQDRYQRDDVLTTPELNDLVGRIEGKEGILAAFQGQLGLAGSISKDGPKVTSRLRAAIKKKIARVRYVIRKQAQLERDLEGVERKLKLSKDAKARRGTLVEQIQRIDDKKTKTAADHSRRRRLLEELRGIEASGKNSPELAKRALGYRQTLGDLRDEARKLTGYDKPRYSDSARKGSQIKIEQSRLNDLTNVMGDIKEALRPGGIKGSIEQWQNTAFSLRKDGATRPEQSQEGERADMLRNLLNEANLRTAVSEAQFKVLRDMPPYGGIFHQGGIVPGPRGADRTIIAQGGEIVSKPGQLPSQPVVQIQVAPGMEWLRQFIKVEVRNETRSQAKRAGALI